MIREGWESGVIQAIGLAVMGAAAWLGKAPQKAWTWWKGRKEYRDTVADGMAKLATLADDMAKISYQISPNGGGSLRDAVDRSEKMVLAAQEALAGIRTTINLNTAILRFQADTSDEIMFFATPDGQNTYSTAAYQKLLGVAARDLEGFSWKNYIAPEDAQAYLEDQETCARERRRFQRRVNMVRADGSRVLVDVTITQYPDDRTQGLQSLMGHIRPVSE